MTYRTSVKTQRKVLDSPINADYVVIHSEPNLAKILRDQQEKASLEKVSNGLFKLKGTTESQTWILTSKVDGKIRPFSIACYVSEKPDEPESGELCLKIKDHIFSHDNKFYSVGGAIPEGISPRDCIIGTRYICRLVNFPFSHIDDIDEETKHQLKRHRGVAVGEIHGLGADGYHVSLYQDELTDIGLQLTASTYLLYTTR